MSVDAGPIDILPFDASPRLEAGTVSVPVGVSTLAGGSEAGFVDGPGAAARFSDPVNVAVGPDGLLYVADFSNGAVRVLNREGETRTLLQGLVGPSGLAFDASGALVVTSDEGLLRRVDRSTGDVQVIATGLGLARGVVSLPEGRFATTALTDHVLWLIEAGGTKTILAGAPGEAGLVDAPGAAARFNQPVDLLVYGSALLVADLGNDRIRSVTLDGQVATFAGSSAGFLDGPLLTAQLSGPSGLAMDQSGNIYFSDRFNYRIRQITPSGQVTTLAGDGTLGFANGPEPLRAEFAGSEGLDIDPAGTVFIADGNALVLGAFHRVRQFAQVSR